MTRPFEVPPHTLNKQYRASDPAQSVWVSANAGSGKTHVLTQRVVRLLLKGVAPARILCLTFTKAAAANMSERVFGTLARWTRLDDDELRAAIAATGAPMPDKTELLAARKLFARTVETPGGLKIQTIHAFCERLLHLFPFEANVPSRFEVADDMLQAELLARARRETLALAASDGGALGSALALVADECGVDGFESLIKEAMGHRGIFSLGARLNQAAVLREVLGVAEGRDGAAIQREMIEGSAVLSRSAEFASWLDSGTKTDSERAALLRRAAKSQILWQSGSGPMTETLAPYLAVFFTKNGEGPPAAKLVTKTPAGKRPELAAMLDDEQVRLVGLCEESKTAATCERTLALLTIIGAILSRYELMKTLRGVLDFDDLIEKTLGLLERSEASWVLYKLDRGIDHVLVDEAQDTSAGQWKILEDLTGDFATGVTPASRTFFAVGDEKQSIFSFQGAAPKMFGAMRRKFEGKFQAAAWPFAHVPLTQSFRSVAGILAAVDKIFEPPEHQRGLVDDDIWMGHEALKAGLPGLIEIWPATGTTKEEQPGDWRLPLDVLDAQDPASLVAQRVAKKIAELLGRNSSERVFDNATLAPRAIRPSDILILVRTRGPFFEAVIRALKQNKIPVAGADRLELSGHIAVMDLVAAGRAALLPQDDLTLACVLKSPLIGLDDDDLLAFAPGRPGSLLDALANSDVPRHKSAFETLMRWRARKGLSPFAFYAQILGQDFGRRALEARLGTEARDAIDEFLRLALAHESEAAPSLTGFLDMVETMTFSIKRDMESGTDAVRVMTVHAAKGLEAKIVFLPDTCGAPRPQQDPKIFELGDPAHGRATIGWSPRKAADCGIVAAAREEVRKAAADEYRRLLYVAVTRAEERLYIAGFHGAREPEAGTWAGMIESSLETFEGMTKVPAFWNRDETLWRWVSSKDFPAAEAAPLATPPGTERLEAPDWLFAKVTPEPAQPPPIRPATALDSADGAKAATAQDSGAALQAGRLTHALLQYLPGVAPAQRHAAGLAYLAAKAGGLNERARMGLVLSAEHLLAMPSLASLFGQGSQAEVSVAGKVFLPSRLYVEISGRIDRIVETSSEIIAADFKTGAPREAAETPIAYLTQMALYRAVLAPLWPEKTVRMVLIWTEGPALAWLDHDRLEAALARFDEGGMGLKA
jgi:ATP-dependent helicase/nuclease subunit A